MKLPHYDNVQQFLEAMPPDQRPLFDQLSALVEEMYPDAERVLWYQAPTYRTKTGYLALGHWKGGVSIYPGGALAEAFEAAHPGYKTGRGTISFKLGEELPLEALKDVIRSAMEGT